MDVEVVHHQVNGLRVRIFQRQGDGNLSELKGRTVGCRKGEMSSCFRLYDAENVGSPATLVFVIPPCLPSWCHAGRGGRRSACKVIGFSSKQITGWRAS